VKPLVREHVKLSREATVCVYVNLSCESTVSVRSVRNKGGSGGVRPPKSMRDPFKVVICRDPGGSHKNPLIVRTQHTPEAALDSVK